MASHCIVLYYIWLVALQVFLARHRTEDVLYAIKVLSKSQILNKNEVRHIMAERRVLESVVSHPFLVGMKYSFQTPEKLYFVLCYVNGGEVSTHWPLTFLTYVFPNISLLSFLPCSPWSSSFSPHSPFFFFQLGLLTFFLPGLLTFTSWPFFFLASIPLVLFLPVFFLPGLSSN